MTADLILVGGDIHTMDDKAPKASAMAIVDGRILAIGSDSSVAAFIGDKTRVVLLNGRSVSPGLADAHAHLYGLGKSLESVNLRGVTSVAAATKLVAAEAKEVGAASWVVGRGWDQNLWEGQAFPNKDSLDAIAPEQPVSLRRIDGHALWANSAAMSLAGIEDSTANPEGGTIVRDAAGHATGVFIDMAMDLIENKIPRPNKETLRRRILRAAHLAASHGITTVHEMGVSDEIADIYQGLADERRLPIRVYGFLSGDLDEAKGLAKRNVETDRDGRQFFVLRGIKLYIDGALGSRGAAMLEPYSDDTGNKGLWLSSAEDIEQAALLAAAAGWQLAVHAIGDAGNRSVLDAFEVAIKASPKADLRFRVEHAQVVSLPDLARFADLGVIASMQPTHATSDMPWAEARVGAERIRGAYAWRSLLESGAHLAAGSDFPVERVSPLLGIYAAVTRQDGEGSPTAGWYPEQKMTLSEALRAFTVEPAYASFVEENRGVLRSGYVADLTVYDRSLVGDASLLSTKIDMTIVDGTVAYERK